MGKRITDKHIEHIREYASQGYNASEIADLTGLKKSQIYHQLQKIKVSWEIKDPDQKEDGSETEGTDEEEIDWEYWAHFWKQKYLELHADKIMDEHLSE